MISITSIMVNFLQNNDMTVNAAWHMKNKMPKNPTIDERVEWHLTHSKNCTCRPLGGKILEEIKKRKSL